MESPSIFRLQRLNFVLGMMGVVLLRQLLSLDPIIASVCRQALGFPLSLDSHVGLLMARVPPLAPLHPALPFQPPAPGQIFANKTFRGGTHPVLPAHCPALPLEPVFSSICTDKSRFGSQ